MRHGILHLEDAIGQVLGHGNNGSYSSGIASGGSMTNCYYNSGLFSPTADVSDPRWTTGRLTGEQFANRESFKNWDFENVWIMTEEGYPELRIFLSTDEIARLERLPINGGHVINTITPISSTASSCWYDYPSEKSYDGEWRYNNGGSSWISDRFSYENPRWIKYDLGKLVNLTSIKVSYSVGKSDHFGTYTVSYLGSNDNSDESWKNFYTEAVNINTWEVLKTFDVSTEQPVRYIKITFNTSNTVGINEIEFMGYDT